MENMQTKSQLNVLYISNGFQFAKLFSSFLAEESICVDNEQALYLWNGLCLDLFDADIQLSFFCQDFHVWLLSSIFGQDWCQPLEKDVNIKIWTMSTLGFGQSRHIFVKLRGTSACSYSMAVPHTPDWLLFDDTGTYDAVICAKWNCNLECINKVIRYWIKSCISFWRRMEEFIAQERVTFQYKITSAGTEGSEQ